MVAQQKRRHFTRTWSLSVVVASMLLLVAMLASIQRADVIAELANQVAHGETHEATAAVRKLARIPRPPLPELVAAAVSPNLEVAREAQHAIDDYLRFCQREIKAQRRVGEVAGQLTVLAESLAKWRASFETADYSWVESTTRKVVLLANQMAPRQAPLVAAQCDEVLTAIAMASANASRPSFEKSRQIRRDQRLAALAAEPWSERPGDANGFANNVLPGAPSTANGIAIPLSISVDRQAAGQSPTVLDSNEARAASSGGAGDSDWQAQWSHPVLRTLPARPISATPVGRDSGDATPVEPHSQASKEPHDSAAADNGLSDVDSRKLLARWLVAEGGEVYPLEGELTVRGFGRLSARLVEQLFSDQVEHRLRLVDDVLTEAGVDARPWLLILADDPDADVRLVVVTIMATSNDRALVEKAWQVAIRDRDPRIAGLAERLRERRR